jgi:hypothetical protein
LIAARISVGVRPDPQMAPVPVMTMRGGAMAVADQRPAPISASVSAG